MRYFFLFFVTILLQNAFAQVDSTKAIEEVFKVVDEMPRFPGCEVGVMTAAERRKCAEDNMLKFIYSNISYPDSARAKGIEGRVVLQFVVEKNGRVSDTKILKDIGEGCGEEALRVVNIMRDQNIIWRAGKQKGVPVNVQYTLPVKFKLEAYTPPPPYTIYNGDSIYLQLSKSVEFKGGQEALNVFLATETEYPDSGLDSCLIGSLRSSLLVRKDGSVELLETVDYSDLGTDFLFEVIKLIPKMESKWTPATYEEKVVTSIYPVRIEFRPTNEMCKAEVEKYEALVKTVEEAVGLHEVEKSEEGVLKINEAIATFPNNTEWIYFRAIMNLGMSKNTEACEDFQRIRDIQSVPWYEKWIDVICGF